jgi:hypothetical protein
MRSSLRVFIRLNETTLLIPKGLGDKGSKTGMHAQVSRQVLFMGSRDLSYTLLLIYANCPS